MSNWLNLSENDVKVITSEEDLFVVKANNTLIEIPNNATNGEVIKALFDCDFVEELFYSYVVSILGNKRDVQFDKEFWNAPYKGNKE